MTALDESIAVWKTKQKAKTPAQVQMGYNACPLCAAANYECDGCPIAADTGQDMCNGSPYTAANDAFEDWQQDWLLDRDSEQKARKAFRREARKMIEYMEGLRT